MLWSRRKKAILHRNLKPSLRRFHEVHYCERRSIRRSIDVGCERADIRTGRLPYGSSTLTPGALCRLSRTVATGERVSFGSAKRCAERGNRRGPHTGKQRDQPCISTPDQQSI